MDRNDHFQVGASPVAHIAEAGTQFARRSGIVVPQRDYSRIAMPVNRSRQIADAYDKMPDFDPKAVPAFKQMAEETGRQFDLLTGPRSRGGLGINVEVTKDDPYGDGGFNPVDNLVHELRHDVTHNNRIKVLSAASTGGHPVFSDDQNNMFRAVHDVFGHLGSGRGIDMHGEEAAFQKHASMFSPLARQAMATETRGQNAALHAHGEFQEQKVGFLPEHMQRLQFSDGGSPEERMSAVRDAINENRKQGL